MVLFCGRGQVETQVLGRVLVSRGWPHLIRVVIESLVDLREVTAPIHAVMEEVDAWSHAVWRGWPRDSTLWPHTIWPLVLPSIHVLNLPSLSLAALCGRLCVIQVLSSVWLLLATRRPLPLLKLLVYHAVLVLYGNDWLPLSLTDKALQLVLDLGLLLLQVLRLKDGRLLADQLRLPILESLGHR